MRTYGLESFITVYFEVSKRSLVFMGLVATPGTYGAQAVTDNIYSELEELGEQLPRYRPDSIAALRRATRFTEPELKRLYRGFKAECPTGVVREDTFKIIYSQFFPQG
ncbi:hypothetical protein ACJJTC_001635, partial [Scirpophaga incertulas]